MNAYGEDDQNQIGQNQHMENEQYRERGGLIPVTASIIAKAQVTKEETIEFYNLPISDIKIAGFVIAYKESDHSVKIKIWDRSGTVEVNFFNKLEGQDNSGLSGFYFNGVGTPVEIFGTLKVYKNEKNIQGAKLLISTANKVLYHRAQVCHAWAYLTGKLAEAQNQNFNNNMEGAKNIAMGNNQFSGQKAFANNRNNNSGLDAIEKIQYQLRAHKNKFGENISSEQLIGILRRCNPNGDIQSTIDKLIGQGLINENDGSSYDIL